MAELSGLEQGSKNGREALVEEVSWLESIVLEIKLPGDDKVGSTTRKLQGQSWQEFVENEEKEAPRGRDGTWVVSVQVKVI